MKLFVTLPFLRAIRVLFLVATCALLIFSNAVPAFAIESYQSDVKEGPTQLLETQKLTDEVSRYAPGTPNMEQSQERANKGLNEVQGDADIDKMKTPENSQDAVTVEDEVNNLLKKVTGKK
jgi:hypothetical protein